MNDADASEHPGFSLVHRDIEMDEAIMTDEQAAADFSPTNYSQVRILYRQLLDAWNNREASAFAALFMPSAIAVGFDGSVMNGRTEIESALRDVFRDHTTAAYVAKIKDVQFPVSGMAIVHAIVGMVPPGQSDIKSDVNAIQCLVAILHQSQWRILLFQNTPAAFHGRPEMRDKLTAELRALL